MPDSRMQIQRYIRLNNLQPALLDMVDEKRISFIPAVELSYLTEEEQCNLIETIEKINDEGNKELFKLLKKQQTEIKKLRQQLENEKDK